MKKGVFMKSALTEMQNQYMKLSYSERLFADYILRTGIKSFICQLLNLAKK